MSNDSSNIDSTRTPDLNLGFSQTDLMKLARNTMPFGKYAGRPLIDLPEKYLYWFRAKGFPKGELCELMMLCLELKIEGLDGLIKPLKMEQKV